MSLSDRYLCQLEFMLARLPWLGWLAWPVQCGFLGHCSPLLQVSLVKKKDRVLMTGKPQHIPRQTTEDLTLLGGPACIVLTSRIWDHVVESYHSCDIGSSALACPFPLAGSRKWTPGPGMEPLALALPRPGLCFG